MKKLMIAAVAMAAGVAFADGEITSQNIVGYKGSALEKDEGCVAIGAQFITISQSGIKLKDIKPIAADGTTSLRRQVQIQLLDKNGVTTTTYRWENNKGKTWIDENGADAGETVIPQGQGMWVLNKTSVGVTFQTAGQVSKSDIIQPLSTDEGCVMVANGFPMSVALKNIIPTTDSSTALRRQVQIQLLDKNGVTTTTYRWENNKGKTWIDENNADAGETLIPAGAAMWVLNKISDPVTLRIVAPTSAL